MSNRFDLDEGKRLRNEGMKMAASAKKRDLETARQIAHEIGQASGECNIDEVQERLISLDIDLGMAAGSVFKDGCWADTGRRIKTARVSSHARPVTVWAYLGAKAS